MKLKGQLDWQKRTLKLGEIPEGTVTRVKAGTDTKMRSKVETKEQDSTSTFMFACLRCVE